jgi:hypothetical protein
VVQSDNATEPYADRDVVPDRLGGVGVGRGRPVVGVLGLDAIDLGFGRIVGSETEAPNILVNLL